MADSLDLSVSEARQVVLEISHDKGWVEPELQAATDPRVLEIVARVRRELGDTVETIARDIYSQKSRFILEFIQNTEDCRFSRTNEVPSLSFEVHPERIVVESNEDGFTANDVRQICRTGPSWKRQEYGYVGEKGIGFKSVFQVASKVHIQSNSFSFYFKYHRDGTSEDKLGMVTPIAQDDPIPLDERPLTRITLTPNNIRYEELVTQFEMIHISLLLFLSKIRKIKVKIHRPERRATVTTFQKYEDTAAHLTYLTKTCQDGDGPDETDTDTSLYYIFKTPISGLPDDEARPAMNECELVLAFPVDNLDHPCRPTQHDIFAFLPVGTIGLNFLIQADFILQANREEIKFDSDWNKALLTHIANEFCNAVLDFCRRDSHLRYQWIKFLPAERALETHQFWKRLSSNIIDLLKDENTLYLHESSELRPPGMLRTLPSEYLDTNGSPLFRDRPGRHRKYLSLEYDREDIATLKRLFNISDIEDLAMCHRIAYDLGSPDSRIKSGDTTDEWHGRAARLILSILGRSRGTDVERMITGSLPLIPLNDARWVCASENDVYFPTETGPAIPQDLIVTIRPEAMANRSRERMFVALGAIVCQPGIVVTKLWDVYLRQGGASDLTSSIEHLRYLYWNHEDSSEPRFFHLWIYDERLTKVNPRRKVIYLPSEDEFGPQELFRSVQYPRGASPECPVPFANLNYMETFSPATRRHGRSWLNWLNVALGVRDVPRLKFDAGSLATEFRHILHHRPDKIIGTLKKYWLTYRAQMTSVIVDEISTSKATCWGVLPTELKCTYFPMPRLREEAQNLGIVRGFPFLDLPNFPGDSGLSEDWRFLERFQVEFQANLNFYLDILSQHESRRQKPWGDEARVDILNTYAYIADHCSESNMTSLVETFHRENLILDPCSFAPSSTGPRWIDVDSCVWKGPDNLLDKTPLASISQYRTNRKVTRLFHEILNIQNANWNDYIRTLSKLKTNPNTPVDIADRALRLYKLFSEGDISDADWNLIRNSFENEVLIYVSSTCEWFSPSQCLWSSPVSIDGKAVIGNDYPESLRNFFLERLQIAPASLATIVEGLRSLDGRSSSVANITQMIWAINAMDPKQGDLDSLRTCNIFPVGGPGSVANIRLRSCQDNFAITDRKKLADIFRDHVDLLAYSLEEVCELDPFLQALGLNEKFLSQLCTEKTACHEDGIVEESLTAEFKDRAYDLLRCAVSNRSPLTVGTPQVLYDRLLATSVFETDSISTQYTLSHANEDATITVSQSTGYVHIKVLGNQWQIFVPRLRSNREVCYRIHLPEALAKLFQIPKSAREPISHVLNSTLLAIDDLLEIAGIGKVPGIEPLPRRMARDLDEQQEVAVDEAAGVLTDALSGVSRQSRAFQVSRPSTVISQDGFTPTRSSSTIEVSPEPVRTPQRSPTPANIPRPNIYGNIDAYAELLDHVIRIAGRTNIPRHDFLAAPANGQYLRGYDHQAAFGVRSLDQRHDFKIGAAGELFVFEVLLDAVPNHFSRNNWKSTIRNEVTVHPMYRDMEPWNHSETADIVYKDTGSRLTRLLIQRGYLEDVWRGVEPEYLIEVKTTTGNCSDRLFMSDKQYRMMQQMALRPGRTSENIYAIFRVFDLGKESMNVKIYVDPEAHRRRNALLFECQTWTVKPGP